MKRKLSVFAVALAVLAFACSAWACEMPSLFGGSSGSGGKAKLSAPKCVLLDDYVYWDSVEGANGYVVSVDGEEMPEQTECGYTVPKDADCQVRVKAVDKKGNFSSYGNTVNRSADPTELVSVTSEEAGRQMILGGSAGYYLDYSEDGTTVFTVNPNVKYIKIYTANDYRKMAFIVEARTEQLIFELAGAFIGGMDDGDTITVKESRLADGADIVVRSSPNEKDGDTYNYIGGGRNTDHGKDGANATDFGREGGNGAPGKAGYCAISAQTVAVSGTEEVEIRGGIGSYGGRGGNSNSNNGGNGGNGGTGGEAIIGSKLYVNIITGRLFSIIGGDGGLGGGKGNINSPLLDIANSAKPGSMGKRGNSFSGETIIISGEVYDSSKTNA